MVTEMVAETGLALANEAGIFTPQEQLRVYETMVLARRLSERLLQMQRSGAIPLAIPCDGHEAAQVGSALAMPRERTVIYPYYRSLASVLAYGMTPLDIMLAAFAKRDDPSTGGRQMPGHYSRADLNIVTQSSEIATQIPHAAGAAYAAKLRSTGQVVVTHFGDGATSQGDFHEGLNFAGIHRLPVIFVCENNGYAISVPQHKQMAIANIADRAASYGFPGVTVDGNDPEVVCEVTRAAVGRALAGDGPTLIEAKTYRFAPHTSDDDDKGYRPPEEIARWKRERDPIARYAARLARRGLLGDTERDAIETRVRQAIVEASRQAQAMADPTPSDLATEVFAAL